jgi:hypothetical protein
MPLPIDHAPGYHLPALLFALAISFVGRHARPDARPRETIVAAYLVGSRGTAMPCTWAGDRSPTLPGVCPGLVTLFAALYRPGRLFPG